MTSERTAISRTKLSAPTQWLEDHGLLRGRVLDFGCGRGDLSRFLGRRVRQFDPFYTPDVSLESLLGRFDTVAMIYVLNVLRPAERRRALNDAWACLRSGGTLYVAVRRDVKTQGRTSKGYQYNVRLDAKVLYERSSRFCIYTLCAQTR